MKMTDPVERFARYDPLSERESRLLLRRVQDEGDLDARQALLRGSGRLIKHLICEFDSPQDMHDDLLQEALIAVNYAITKYDEKRGVTWRSYSYRAARCKMINLLQKTNNEQLTQPEDYSESIADTTTQNQPEDMFFLVCDYLYVRQHLRTLRSRETDVLSSYCGLNSPPETLREIGERLGVSRQRISQLRDQAASRLNRNMHAIPDYPPEEIRLYAQVELG